jgi:hypothetical protein
MSDVKKVSIVMEKQVTFLSVQKKAEKEQHGYINRSRAGFILNPTPPFDLQIPTIG